MSFKISATFIALHLSRLLSVYTRDIHRIYIIQYLVKQVKGFVSVNRMSNYAKIITQINSFSNCKN